MASASNYGFHSYDQGELKAFNEFINDSLKEDPDVKERLPLTDVDSLTAAVKDGILLCKLVNVVSSGGIDERVINRKQPLNIYRMDENLKLAISAAAAAGCRIVNITPKEIMDGKLHLIMGLVWQVVRIHMLGKINIKNNPGIIVLSEEGESAQDITSLSSETVLIRWLRYMLKQAGQEPKINEINSDMKDLTVFSHVMAQLDKDFDKSVIQDEDVKKRAKALIESSNRMKLKSFFTEEALLEGNSKIYLMFTTQLFEAWNELQDSKNKQVEIQETIMVSQSGESTKEETKQEIKQEIKQESQETTKEESKEVVKASTKTEIKEEVKEVKKIEKMENRDEREEEKKEERAFQFWINSLGLEGIYIENFYQDLKDGLVILKLMNYVWPGSVVEGKYEKHPGDNKYKLIGNANYAIAVGKEMKIKTAGLTGTGLAESKPYQVLGLLWQVMRANYLQIIGSTSEEELLSWANKIVDKKPEIKSFKDPALRNSRFLIELMAKLEPEVVDWTLVTAGDNNNEIELNAKYCISVARKLGAKIFFTWEDIKNVMLYFTM